MRIVDDSISVRAEGEGLAIVLVHGTSCSSRCFEHQLASALLTEQFRVLAIDLPGHGDSRPAKTYSLAGYAEALVAAARELHAEEAVFVGWSLGGHVVLEATDRLPRAKGIVIFGAPPVASFADLGRATHPHEELDVASFFKPGTPPPEVFVEDFRKTDPRAQEIGSEMRDEVEIVKRLAVPIAVLHGEDDVLIRRDYLDSIEMPTLWHGAVQDITDAGHAPQWERPERFNELLDAFVRDCNG